MAIMIAHYVLQAETQKLINWSEIMEKCDQKEVFAADESRANKGIIQP